MSFPSKWYGLGYEGSVMGYNSLPTNLVDPKPMGYEGNGLRGSPLYYHCTNGLGYNLTEDCAHTM